MAKWSPYTACDGQVHSLAHFHPRLHTYELQPTLSRPNPRQVQVRSSFSLHCFTRTPEAGEQVQPCQVYCRNPAGRVFSFERAELGRALPEIVASLPDRNCYATDRRNHVLFCPTQLPNGDEYAVFFALRKASPDTDWDANLMILSAHARRGFRPGGKPEKVRNLLWRMP